LAPTSVITSKAKSETSHPSAQYDKNDFTTLKYGQEISLRGRFGKYLTALRGHLDNDTTIQHQLHSSSVTYHLGVVGQGIGEVLDCLVFINVDKRDHNGPVLFGSTVAIKAPAAMERCDLFSPFTFGTVS
jgi:hypothetical protein